MGCYAVLDGISSAYPPATGRFHTRYSPVRRSPAVYCYTPMPLDLHVLSLSLAFILSQDQTLRCCLSFLFLFYFINRAGKQERPSVLFCSLFCLHRKTFKSRPVRDVRSLYLLRLSVELTESFVLLTLVLLSMSIVILSMCSVLSSRLPHQAFSGKTLQR